MESKVIAIHQPNLFPWLGYFAKIYKSNIFVFLDHTINNRTDQIYTRRVQILNTQGEASYLTIPIKKIDGSDFGPINQWDINFDQVGFPRKQLESIIQTYRKSPYFNEVFPLIENLFDDSKELNLVARNIDFIKETCRLLGIETPFLVSSEINSRGNSTELLISIVTHLQGTHYLSGKGGDNYQDPEIFVKANIILERIVYKHPIYLQEKSKEFKSGLSIIDCLMNIGYAETSRLIKLGDID